MATRFPAFSPSRAGGSGSVRGGSGFPSSTSTTTTLLGNLATLSLAAAENASSLSSNSSSWANYDDLMDGNNFSTVTTFSNITEPPPHQLPHPLWLTITIGLLAGLLVVLTVLGNITVLLAFGLERTIRQPTNYFLASLAVSDLLIGTFSMPLYTQYLLFGVWPLGQWLCDLWLSLDWTVCLTSQYTVFLITMDRYLSVKIPAKYRNWRTERKVLSMISVTWILPTLVFFTSIIGWQFFVGERTVLEGTCEVQFMTDTMFTFVLTIGYYWITLLVIGVLYGGIYKVALDLQRKSDAKHKKLQSTMELAGEGPHRGNNALGNAEGGSNNNSSGGDSNVPTQNKSHGKSAGKGNNRKSVRAALPCPLGVPAVNTTSFSTKKDEKDDDRSSSPAFASDDENSSSGGAVGAPKSPLSSGVYIGRPNPAAGIVNSALFANTGGLVRSLHGDLFFGGQVDRQEAQTLLPSQPPSYTEVISKQNASTVAASASDASEGTNGKIAKRNDEDTDDNLYMSASEKQTTPLLKKEEINKGCRYIDEKSFLTNLNSDSAALLPDISKDASEIEDSDVNEAQTASSPIWKRRHSLPLESCDGYDELDDEVSEFITGDPTTTTTSLLGTPEAKRYDRYRKANDVDDDDEDTVGNDKEIMRTGAGDDDSDHDDSTTATPTSKPNKTNVVSFDAINKPQTPIGNNVSSSNSGDPRSTTTPSTNTTSTSNNTSSLPPAAAAGAAADTATATATTTLSAACNNYNNNNITPTAPGSDGNEESSRSDTHCLSAAHRRRNNNDTRLHTFVKSVRSRNSRRRNRRERKSKSENRARKALRTITIILGAFVLCWTPFHICVMIIAICSPCMNQHVYAFAYWMCYLNSPINPFCYAFANAQFKRTFLRIMRFDWHRT